MSNLPSDHHFFLHRLFMPQPNPYVKVEFKIIRSLLPPKTRHTYLYQDGKLDYLGQLITQLGYNVEGKHRFPSDLKKIIPPFTYPCRGAILNTHTTLSILSLDILPLPERERQLSLLLPNWNITYVS